MSNAIRYDPLLVHYLAEELDRLLRGRSCASAPFFAARRVALLPLDRGEALEMDLHPRRGWLRLVPWEAEGYEADAVCTGVDAPADERRLRIGIEAPDRFRSGTRRLEVELHTNQWNVLLVSEPDERVHATLWARRAGDRALTAGAGYRPPPASARIGAGPIARDEALALWLQRLGAAPPEEWIREIVSAFAWTGAVNAPAILGDAAATVGDADAGDPGTDPLVEAFDRWWALRALPPARPVVLTRGPLAQPYPMPLDGWTVEAVPTLLAAMEQAALGVQGEGMEAAPADALVAAARLRLEGALRRVQRLEEERQRENEAEGLRRRADLLLAKLHEIPKGSAEVTLTGWQGEEVRLRLDPTVPPAENATAWYTEARKRERAAERLPRLIEEAQRVVERWGDAVRRGEAGELPEWVAREISRGGTGDARDSEGAGLPYRVFRSSGGLEIRVGRSSKANDQLTFGHSSPNDVWLHARSVPGSHVILRWRDAEGAPPARDLEEAARLAAYYSKARSSAVVPVDWTRRKYVRKPRGAAPGSVIPQRVRTLFVEPYEEKE